MEMRRVTYSSLDVGFAEDIVPDVRLVCTILVDS
jgi:hypothetical protein